MITLSSSGAKSTIKVTSDNFKDNAICKYQIRFPAGAYSKSSIWVEIREPKNSKVFVTTIEGADNPYND